MADQMMGWQLFYLISMFAATLSSYLLPVLVVNRQRQRQRRRQRPISQSLTASHQRLIISTAAVESPADRQMSRTLSACNCVAAGIFLGVCFLNLVPYVEDEFRLLFDELKMDVDFPVGQLTVILGLFLLLTLETLIDGCRRRRSAAAPPVLRLDDDDTNDDASQNDEQIQELLELPADKSVTVADEDVECPPALLSHSHHYLHPNNTNQLRIHHPHQHRPQHQHGCHSHHIGPDEAATGPNASMFSFFVLMFATSVHSVFEGLALGLQRETSKSLHLFIGIIVHECLVALALGLNAARFDASASVNIRFAGAFSCTIPAGIVMGVALGYTPGLVGRAVSALFQGLAAGTFIYVTFHELIPAEFMTDHQHTHHHHHQHSSVETGDESPDSETSSWSQIYKIFLLFVGFAVMAFMTALTDSH